MYNGFAKLNKDNSRVYHLGTNNVVTLCGISVYKGEWEIRDGAQDPPKDKTLCKNCRQSIFKIGRDD